MSVEFVEGERYIVISHEGPSFIGTFLNIVGEELRFKGVTEFVELSEQLSGSINRNAIVDAESYRQRVEPANGQEIATARSLAKNIEQKKRVCVTRLASRDIEA